MLQGDADPPGALRHLEGQLQIALMIGAGQRALQVQDVGGIGVGGGKRRQQEWEQAAHQKRYITARR
ncbi:hypothetical protein D3C72_2277110 [compost metagenome]